jgi:hypothetical protein
MPEPTPTTPEPSKPAAATDAAEFETDEHEERTPATDPLADSSELEAEALEATPASDSAVAPPAHSAAARSAPTPPAWSYRAAGAPVGPPVASDRQLEMPAPPVPTGPPRLSTHPPLAMSAELPVRTASASLGPVGKRRRGVVVVLFSVLTLGVYTLIWHARINREVGDFDPQMHVRPGRSMVAVAIAWLLGVLISLAGGARIVLDLLHVGLPFDPQFTVTQAYYLLGGIAVIPYLELVLSFSAVAIVMTLERLRIAEERVGRTTDVQLRPTRAVWWLVLPVAGGLVLVAKMQRRANQVWDIAAPRPAARISRY